jgi:ATP-dependent Clp protease ATP-binding subunit ClpB
MSGIVDIQLGYLRKLLGDRRIMLTLNDDAKKWLADKGYDPAYGARPLKRVIQTYLQNRLAQLILKGEIADGAAVAVGVKADELDFKIGKPTAGKVAA